MYSTVPVNEKGKTGCLVIAGYDRDVVLEQQQQVTVQYLGGNIFYFIFSVR